MITSSFHEHTASSAAVSVLVILSDSFYVVPFVTLPTLGDVFHIEGEWVMFLEREWIVST